MSNSEAPIGMMDAMYKRRSVRAYAPKKLDNACIRTLLAASVQAPTAMHREPWQFVVVQDETLLKRLSDRAKTLSLAEAERAYPAPEAQMLDMLRQPDFNVFYNAGTLIVICAKPLGQFVAADCWMAAQNLMLAACSMGLGTCVIGLAVAALNAPEVKTELGIPAGVTAIAPIIVGVPSDETPTVPRKEPEILAWK
jgi:nitroreductase